MLFSLIIQILFGVICFNTYIYKKQTTLKLFFTTIALVINLIFSGFSDFLWMYIIVQIHLGFSTIGLTEAEKLK